MCGGEIETGLAAVTWRQLVAGATAGWSPSDPTSPTKNRATPPSPAVPWASDRTRGRCHCSVSIHVRRTSGPHLQPGRKPKPWFPELPKLDKKRKFSEGRNAVSSAPQHPMLRTLWKRSEMRTAEARQEQRARVIGISTSAPPTTYASRCAATSSLLESCIETSKRNGKLHGRASLSQRTKANEETYSHPH